MAPSTFSQPHEQRKIEKLMLRLATIKPFPSKIQPQQQSQIQLPLTTEPADN